MNIGISARSRVMMLVSMVPLAVVALTLGGCPPIDDSILDLFTRGVVDTVPAGGASALAWADFNGDGRADLVSVWEEAGEVRLHLHQVAAGVVSWTNVKLLSGDLAAGAQAVTVADISNDGRWDVVVGTSAGRMVYLRQTGSSPGELSNWNISIIGAAEGVDPWTDLQAADVDGDGRVEIVASQTGSRGRISILNPPAAALDGSDWARVEVATSGRSGSNQVIPVDMDGDGDVDVVSLAANEESDSIAWYANPGNNVVYANAWVRHAIAHVPNPQQAAFADVDGDGFSDIVVVSGTGRSVVWLKLPASLVDLLDQTKRWSQYPIYPLGADAGAGVAAFDYDGDGLAEVFVGTKGTGRLTMFYVDGPVWVEKVLDDTGGDYGRLLVVDVDADGASDIVTSVADTNGTVLWYRQK